jgi:hypothetical protein
MTDDSGGVVVCRKRVGRASKGCSSSRKGGQQGMNGTGSGCLH